MMVIININVTRHLFCHRSKSRRPCLPQHP